LLLQAGAGPAFSVQMKHNCHLAAIS
jgi:hypothetical protein